MVDVTKRYCVKNWEITAENGDHFEVKRGQTYTTTLDVWDNGTVTVFSNFWVPVPVECFGERTVRHKVLDMFSKKYKQEDVMNAFWVTLGIVLLSVGGFGTMLTSYAVWSLLFMTIGATMIADNTWQWAKRKKHV